MPDLRGIHHVKLPVSDVGRSRDWYERVLDLEVEIEFVEDGVLRGVAVRDRAATLSIALREDPERAAVLRGFDPLSLAVGDRDDLRSWCDRLDGLGEAHGGVHTGHQGWVLIGLHDPDGLEVRLYTRERHDGGGS